MTRKRVKQLIADLAKENPKVPSNMLSALGNVQLSQLMDRELWDFKGLKAQADAPDIIDTDDDSLPWATPAADASVNDIQPMVQLIADTSLR